MKIWLQLVILSLLSGPALATPPYSGTVFVDPDILITDDPSTFVQAVSTGSGSRQMFDRRVGKVLTLNALLFDAYYTDGSKVEVQVNPEFDLTEATRKAAFYGHAIGQLPLALRVYLETVTLTPRGIMANGWKRLFFTRPATLLWITGPPKVLNGTMHKPTTQNSYQLTPETIQIGRMWQRVA